MKKKDYSKKLRFRTRLEAERGKKIRRVLKTPPGHRKAVMAGRYDRSSAGETRMITDSPVKSLINTVIKVIAFDTKTLKYMVRLIGKKFRGKNKFMISRADYLAHTRPYSRPEPEERFKQAPAPKPTAAQKKLRRRVVTPIGEFKPLAIHKVIKRIMPSKSTYTVLHNFLIENKTIMVTDLDLFFVKKDPVAADKENGLYVLADKNFVKTELDPLEYPEVPNYKNKFKFEIGTINRKALLTELSKAVEYVSTDFTRRPMIGILLHVLNDHYARVCATDGASLYVGELDIKAKIPGEYIINAPYKLIDALRSFDDAEINITAESDPETEFPRAIAFNASDGFLAMRLLEGPYPNYSAVWHKCNTQIAFNRQTLLDILSEWAPFVREFHGRQGRVSIHVDQNKMTLWCQAAPLEQVEYPKKGYAKFELPVELRETYYKPELGSLLMPLRIDADDDDPRIVEETHTDFFWWFDYYRLVNVLKTYDGEKMYVGVDWNGWDPHTSLTRASEWIDKDLSEVFKIEKYEHPKPDKSDAQKEFETQIGQGFNYIGKNFDTGAPTIWFLKVNTPEDAIVKILNYSSDPQDEPLTVDEKFFRGLNAGAEAVAYIKSKADQAEWLAYVDQSDEQWTEVLKQAAHDYLDQETARQAEESAPVSEAEPSDEAGEPMDYGYSFGTGLVNEMDTVKRIALPPGFDVLSSELQWNIEEKRYQYNPTPPLLLYNPVTGMVYNYVGNLEREGTTPLARLLPFADEQGNLLTGEQEEAQRIMEVLYLYIPVRQVESA